ncbi:component of the counting factor complex [Planoprotostelium fungivorum]|uniref:Component of the counting factor complex n=1 Tax=Planoprotostelium fungivorum TaxID=1890364 RepID=A0A2P6NZU5_9EUKA|nr:component of the counting factor complex [Planoprotostelium fungivorum]
MNLPCVPLFLWLLMREEGILTLHLIDDNDNNCCSVNTGSRHGSIGNRKRERQGRTPVAWLPTEPAGREHPRHNISKRSIMNKAVLLFCLLQVLLSAADDHYCQSTLPVFTPTPGYRLEFVQTVTRHGARTPIYLVPPVEQPLVEWNCKLHELVKPSQQDHSVRYDTTKRLFRKVYRDGVETLKGNCNFGQLTDVGYSQHLELGQALRKVYADGFNLFGPQPKLSQIRVRSTDVYRTLQSAQAGLTGMFPEHTSIRGVETLLVETTDNSLEDMTPNSAVCPPLQTEMNRLHASKEWTDQQEKTRNLTETLQKAFGVSTLPPWDGLYDIYQLRRCANLPVPKEITEDLFQQIRLAAEWEVNVTAYDPAVGRYGMGTFLNLIKENIQNYVKNGTSEVKYLLYSGHDSTVAPLLGLLNIYDGLWPPFRAYVNFELYSRDGEHFVQVKYNGKEMKLPACEKVMCPVKTVLAFFQERVVTPQQCGRVQPAVYARRA